MRKRLLSLCLMAVVTAIGISAWALEKNSEGAYQIGSAADLKAFAELVNGGEKHAWGQLTADIDYGTEQTMIGTEASTFYGTLDGQGHTIKYNFFPDANGCALIRNLEASGLVQNLHVVGKITTSKQYAAGIVVWNRGVIRNCISEVEVTSGVAGDATHGGIAAVSYQGAYYTNCVSHITIKGEKTENCGGLVGWADTRSNIQNCIVVNNDSEFKITDKSHAFGRNGSKQLQAFNATKYVEFRAGTNSAARQGGACYNNFAIQQWSKDDEKWADGTIVTAQDLANGKVCYMLNNDQHNIVWRQDIGKDACPLPGIFGEGHAQVYASVATNCKGRVEVAAGETAPEVTYTNTPTNVTAEEHTWDNGVCTTCGFFDNDHLAIDPTDGCYMVKTAEDLNWCEIKNQTSNGGWFSMKQMNDIEITAPKGYPIFNTGNWFDGNYNGQGHNLTIDIDFTELNNVSFAALFPQASNCVIENLNLHGTVKTSYNYAGSVIGKALGKTSTLRNIFSDVTVSTTKTGDATNGGIIGNVAVDTKMENVIFAGKVVGVEGTTNMGGIIGWAGNRVTMTNVAMVGEVTGGDDTHSFARNPQSMVFTNCFCNQGNGAPKQDGNLIYFDDADTESGALAYALNGNKNGGEAFYQTINVDKAPYPFTTGDHKKVYTAPSDGYRCDGKPMGNVTYTNTEQGETVLPEHKYKDGFCTVCGDVDVTYMTPAEDGFYDIATPGQLLWWAHYAAKKNLGAKGRLTEDIDMQGIDNYPIIGEETVPFYGCFDGQYHVISNLVINYPDKNGVGFISYINSVPADAEHKDADRTDEEHASYIRNLTLDESCKVIGQAYVGGILGGTSAWQGLVKVQNCVVRCGVYALNGANAGGIHGVCMGSSCAIAVDNCGVTSTIRCKKEGGVISGWMGSYGTLTNCWSISNVYEESDGVNMDADPDAGKRVDNFVRYSKLATVKNNWWLYKQDNVVTNTFKMDIVPTGELAWVLNNKQFKEPVWYQRIGDDEVPFLDKRRGVVAKLYDNYYSIYDDESLTEAIEVVKQANEEYTESMAFVGVRNELSEKSAELDACADYIDLANAMDTLNVYVNKVKASQKMYKAYDDKCQEIKAYLEAKGDFEGEVRDALEDYLYNEFAPNDENPIGSYMYVTENREAADSLVAKETTRVAEWLQEAINTGYMAGSDVTRLIANATFSDGFKGWEGKVGTSTSGKVTTKDEEPAELYAGETWNSTLDMHQTLKGMKPGLYLLKMIGAYRPQDDRYSYNYGATFYANGNANYLMTVIEDPIMVNDTIDQVNCNLHGTTTDLAIYADGTSTTDDAGSEITGYVAHGPHGLAIAGHNGRYINYIAAEVGEDGELNIGIKDPTFNYGSDWVGFGDLRLTYLGTADSKDAAQVDLALKSQLARANTIIDNYLPTDGLDKAVQCAPAYPASLKAEIEAAKAEAEAASTVEDKMACISKFSELFKQLYEAKMAYISYYGTANSIETLANTLMENIGDNYDKLIDLSGTMLENYFDGSVSAEEASHPACLDEEPLATYMPKVDEDGTMHIANAYHMVAFSATVSGGSTGTNAVLDNDIDMTGFRYAPAGAANEGVKPADYKKYSGTFDGQQHAINNLSIGSEDAPYSAECAALFADIQGATVKNLAVNGVAYSNNKYIAGITGRSRGKSLLQNCSVNFVQNSQVSGDATNGGLIGVVEDEGTVIENCYVHAVFNGSQTSSCGGVIGWSSGKNEVKNSLVINEVNLAEGLNSCNSISRNDGNCTVTNTYFTTAMNGTNIGTQTNFEALAKGEITWKLNGSKADGAWFQTLGTDTIPHLYSGDKVWLSAGEYVNEEPIVELNAFAYDVKGKTSEDEVNVWYTLNAPAQAVDVIFYNGDTQVATIPADGISKGRHNVTVANSELGEKGTTLRYEVKVTGLGTKDVAQMGESYKVWSPYGLACNNAPSSPGFGQTYLIETDPDVQDGYLAYGTLYTGYISDKNHSALYAFDQDFQQILNADGNAGFKGGLESKKGICAADGNEYDFKTVRVSKDGRVFVGRGNGLTNSPIVEVNPADLNANWTPVFTGGELDEATGIVYAGDSEQARMVSSFDVEGEGANLKLWVLGNQRSTGGYNLTDYACHTYNLGTATTWTGAASSVFEPLTSVYTIAPKAVNVVSDQKGGLWYIQHRGTPSEAMPALKHYNADGVEDYSDITTSYAQGGMAITADGETFALPTASNQITIYTTDYAPNVLGKIFLNQVAKISVKESSVAAMAFDYAGNLYVASAGTESVSRYTVPRDNKVVVTPAAQTIQLGDPTGIDSVDNADSASSAIYNVAGQRLLKAEKGVNIINGRKVMVK